MLLSLLLLFPFPSLPFSSPSTTSKMTENIFFSSPFLIVSQSVRKSTKPKHTHKSIQLLLLHLDPLFRNHTLFFSSSRSRIHHHFTFITLNFYYYFYYYFFFPFLLFNVKSVLNTTPRNYHLHKLFLSISFFPNFLISPPPPPTHSCHLFS